jgi:hypothetical protein
VPLLAIGYPMGRFGDRYKSDMRCENGPFAGVSQRNLTWEPTGVVEYVIPADFRGGANAARWRGNPAGEPGFELFQMLLGTVPLLPISSNG